MGDGLLDGMEWDGGRGREGGISADRWIGRWSDGHIGKDWLTHKSAVCLQIPRCRPS